MTRLEKGYVLVDELADERPVAKAVGAISLKTGEPAGIRTQDPRLKRAKSGFTQRLGFAKVSPFLKQNQYLFWLY